MIHRRTLMLSTIGLAVALLASGVGAPCWLSVTPDGRFAYVGNGSGSISSYAIGADGMLSLLQSIAALEPAVLLGDDKVVSYAIGGGGELTKATEVVVGTTSQLGLQGMAGI